MIQASLFVSRINPSLNNNLKSSSLYFILTFAYYFYLSLEYLITFASGIFSFPFFSSPLQIHDFRSCLILYQYRIFIHTWICHIWYSHDVTTLSYETLVYKRSLFLKSYLLISWKMVLLMVISWTLTFVRGWR